MRNVKTRLDKLEQSRSLTVIRIVSEDGDANAALRAQGFDPAEVRARPNTIICHTIYERPPAWAMGD
jgi:hypothetical protein